MSGPGFKQDPETWSFQLPEPPVHEQGNGTGPARGERQAEIVRTLWDRRRSLLRAAIVGLVLSTLLAFLLPKSYTSTAQLMPPDPQSGNGLAMMAALAGKTLGNLAGVTGDLLGLKSSGAIFVGVLKSETSQDRIVEQFDLRKVYGKRYIIDARKRLDDNTAITEDRKSGIITIKVSDRDPQRAAAIANAYVDELNDLVTQLSTSAAHRERVFLEQRLKLAKVELDTAADQLAQFSSKNNTLDVQIEGKAMLDAAGNLAGQLIAAESQLEGLRQIYTDNNARVRALKARVDQLRSELEKFGGSKQNPEVDAPKPTNPGLLQTGDPPPQNQPGGSQPFPSIRNLPLLGAKYTDYYRRVKIQEAVFELLTEQFELAKVQEAKETPSVKLLDPGKVPEKKSFPPRLLIMALGTFLVCSGAMVCITATKYWNDVDPNDPRKTLAMEMSAAVRASAPWTAHNGDAGDLWPRRIWNRMTNHQDPPNGEL